MADLKKTIEILFEGNDQASRKAADVLAQIKAMETQAKATTGGTDDLEKSLDKVGKTGSGISAVNAALVTLAGSLAFKAFVDANVAVEKFENGLRAVQGTSVDVGGQLTYVRDMANRLGLDVQTTANSFVQLTAATQGTALQGRGTRDIFEAISQAMGSLGKSSAETEGAFLAITQIVSKGKVTMEELRGQLGERLPGAMQIAARSMGLTTQEFEKLVEKGIKAEDFLPRFATELNRTFASASFDGYQANLNRLRNSVDELLVQAGKTGLFDALTGGVKIATEAIQQGGVEFTFWNLAYEATARLIRNGDFEEFGRGITYAENEAQKLSVTIDNGLNQSVAESTRLLRQQADALKSAFGSDQSDAETARLTRLNQGLVDSAKAGVELDGLLKRLGVDPKKTTEAVEALASDLEALATNPQSNGTLFAQAFEGALKRASSTDAVRLLGERLATLFNDGKISAEAYKEGLLDLEKAFGKVDDSSKKSKDVADESAKAIAKQAAETKKAEEAARQFAIEMEKLASNERIKLIESKVTLDVAQLEADTKRVEAAFESINTTIDSTGDVLGGLFSLFKESDKLSFRDLFAIEKQINDENRRRDDALDLQKRLTEAQIEAMRAQTRRLEKGLSLIQVDGSGLQPHLEAFMWEILKAVQVRVNEDGLEMLLGMGIG